MENKEYRVIVPPSGYKLQRIFKDGTYIDVPKNEAKIYNNKEMKNYRIKRIEGE